MILQETLTIYPSLDLELKFLLILTVMVIFGDSVRDRVRVLGYPVLKRIPKLPHLTGC